MKPHLKYISKYVLLALFCFVVVGEGSFFALKPLIGRSGFRIAMACNAAKRLGSGDVFLFMGDSRVMDGFNAELANAERKGKGKIYNLAFNDVRVSDVASIAETVIEARCCVKRVYINAQGLVEEWSGTSELQVFASAFNPRLIDRMSDKSWISKQCLRVLPLLRFNNEMFQRSLYYVLKGQDDQGHGNSYSFKIHPQEIERLRHGESHFQMEETMARSLMASLRAHDIEPVILLTPYHGSYAANRRNFSGYVNEIRQATKSLNVRFLDHSALFANRPEYFSDMHHLNSKGQKAYTEFLLANEIN